MAEDLTDYPLEMCIGCAIRIPGGRHAAGSSCCASCVWVITTRYHQPFREGLDPPEVSLVAILDADKEGIPAGQAAAWIQTIGRAAATSASAPCTPTNHRLDEGSHRRDRTPAGRRSPTNRPTGIDPRCQQKDLSPSSIRSIGRPITPAVVEVGGFGRNDGAGVQVARPGGQPACLRGPRHPASAALSPADLIKDHRTDDGTCARPAVRAGGLFRTTPTSSALQDGFLLIEVETASEYRQLA